MPDFIRVSGPYGYVLTLLALVVVSLSIHALVLALRGAQADAPLLRERLHALLFWGWVSAVLGFLGQCHGAYQAVGAILAASEISAAVVAEGFVISFVPTLFGLGILVFTLVAWAVVTVLARGSDVRKPAVVAFLLALLGGCQPVPDQLPATLADGVWVLEAGPDRFLWDFVDSVNGVGCLVHNIRDGREFSETPCLTADLSDDRIQVAMGTGVRLEGDVRLERGQILGALHYPDGSSNEVDLPWHPEADYPPLQARPGLAGAYAYRVPPGRDDGWDVADAAGEGVAPEALEALVGAVVRGEAGVLHSLLMVRHGRLVLDEYFHGWGPDDPHALASCTKSVSSLLVGLAIQEGDIPGAQAPLTTWFGALGADTGDGWDRLTLEHLLTMSMALDWSADEAANLHGTGPDFFRRVLSRSVAGTPGRDWSYVSANVDLLAGILREATGEHADAFASRALFEPLRFGAWDWNGLKTDGYPLMDGSLRLLPRDMAKLGQLVLDGGAWNGVQIVAAEWIHASMIRHLDAGDRGDGYGYLWWLMEAPGPGGEPVPAVFANGWGSQFIVAFPTLDMVVITTGGNEYNGMHGAVEQALARYLLPGVEPDA
jgi:CubicO group peptidase (beta-lactamase class C family)